MNALFRPSKKEDCPALAALKIEAAGGILDYMFQGLTRDEDLTDFLARTLADENNGPFSYTACFTAELNGRVAGMAAVHPASLLEITPGMREFFPPERLERLAPILTARVEESLFIQTLAVFPKVRRLGLGSSLVAMCVRQALERGFHTLSLQVMADNCGGRRFYERHGFSFVKLLPLPRHELIPHQGGVILLKRDAVLAGR